MRCRWVTCGNPGVVVVPNWLVDMPAPTHEQICFAHFIELVAELALSHAKVEPHLEHDDFTDIPAALVARMKRIGVRLIAGEQDGKG